ncbi:hypothetical protein C8J56DRAFT_1069425 [Mycena floridula]|nr:hypothetical protein C8J56DRAFT_1069425 [Mycena floridula]
MQNGFGDLGIGNYQESNPFQELYAMPSHHPAQNSIQYDRDSVTPFSDWGSSPRTDSTCFERPQSLKTVDSTCLEQPQSSPAVPAIQFQMYRPPTPENQALKRKEVPLTPKKDRKPHIVGGSPRKSPVKKKVKKDKDKMKVKVEVKVEDEARAQWSFDETNQLIYAVYGPDGAYRKYQQNAGSLWKKLSRELYDGSRDPAALKSKFNRLLVTYKAIRKLNEWTGNGSGDPDITKRIAKARKASIDLPVRLTAKTVNQWMQETDWYEMIDQYERDDPTVTRTAKHRSGAISDSDDAQTITSDSDNDGGPAPVPKSADSKQKKTLGTPYSRQTKPGVPVPPHSARKPVQSAGSETINRMIESNKELQAEMMKGEKAKLDLLEQREFRQAQAASERNELEREKLAFERRKAQIGALRETVKDLELPQAIRDAAGMKLTELLIVDF